MVKSIKLCLGLSTRVINYLTCGLCGEDHILCILYFTISLITFLIVLHAVGAAQLSRRDFNKSSTQ